MPKYISSSLLLLALLGTLTACDFGDLRLFAKFSRISDLKSGDRIIYQNRYIGDVEQITRSSQGHYLVELDINSDHKKNLTVYSIFYIDNDLDDPSRKAVFTEQKRSGGILLVDDSIVTGSEHPPFLRNMLDDLRRKGKELSAELADKLYLQLKNSLAEIERKLQQLEKAIQTAPDSNEARELKRTLDELVTDLETTMAQVKIMIGVDLFNILKDYLTDLRRRLEEFDRGNRPSPETEAGKETGFTI
jgi:ABC-type transporter Mla subunit MlaD